MNHNTFETLKQVIDKSNNLLLISHILPDGDNIGSVLGLSLSLKAVGKNVTPVVNGELPDFYRFLAEVETLISPEDAMDGTYDLVIALDMSDLRRGGVIAEKFYGKVPFLSIDHHISNDFFADYNYIDAKAVSTTQILTEFVLFCGYPLTKEIATSFYVGLLTDSGCFTYDSTSSNSLYYASILLKHQLDLAEIRTNVFENISFTRKKILGRVLETAERTAKGRLVYGKLSYEECQELKAKGQDFEGIIDHLMEVIGVKMSLFFREMEKGVVKVGFRGRGDVDVTIVAKKFGGGGHKNAGGCSIIGELSDSVNRVLLAAEEYLESIE